VAINKSRQNAEKWELNFQKGEHHNGIGEKRKTRKKNRAEARIARNDLPNSSTIKN